jgi:hypothetical protein
VQVIRVSDFAQLQNVPWTPEDFKLSKADQYRGKLVPPTVQDCQSYGRNQQQLSMPDKIENVTNCSMWKEKPV